MSVLFYFIFFFSFQFLKNSTTPISKLSLTILSHFKRCWKTKHHFKGLSKRYECIKTDMLFYMVHILRLYYFKTLRLYYFALYWIFPQLCRVPESKCNSLFRPRTDPEFNIKTIKTRLYTIWYWFCGTRRTWYGFNGRHHNSKPITLDEHKSGWRFYILNGDI